MRVTICCKRFGAGGGAEKFLMNFARCLLGAGHEVKVLAAEFGGETPDVAVETFAVPPAPRMLRDWLMARAAERALSGEDADVTFSDQKCWGADVVRPGGGVQAEYFKQRHRSRPTPLKRTLSRLKGLLSVRTRLRLYVDDRLYAPPGPARVIANSDMVRRHLLKHYPHLRERVRVVYNGAAPDRFHPGLKDEHRAPVRNELRIPQKAFAGVFVGTGWERKGLYTFIEALGILAAEGAPRRAFGVVVGRGNRHRAERYARSRGALKALRFVGRADPRPYYGAADALVLPSFFDPCANVTLEALACGLPVVTSAYNGAYELLTPGEQGYYVEDAADAAGVAEYMKRLMDSDRLEAASEAARELALQHTLERQYRETMDALLPVAETEEPE
ncbi:MAG: glycosyltransferase family 4 protein [Planctomycetota bacterium]